MSLFPKERLSHEEAEEFSRFGKHDDLRQPDPGKPREKTPYQVILRRLGEIEKKIDRLIAKDEEVHKQL